ncbi:MAG: 4-hydroxy-tetrahydrodipicolinate synthase [Bacteroidales bacterium]|nr:4-hydroxy-tetrahydrodipicolinate synthase [Bacteroidales bacterium]
MKFCGCGTALVTPFRDGAVDYEAYAALVRRQVEAGVDFLVPLATTGETPTLAPEEKLELLRLTRENCGPLPLLVGCGSNSVPGTLANIRLCEEYADAWLVVVPFYNKPTQEGMFRYYKAVAAGTDKPVFIYNVPGRTGVNMTAETCLRIAREVPGTAGVKEASGKIEQVAAICKDAPEGFAVLSGDDDLTLEMIKLGAVGVISVASNIVPGKVASMVHSAMSGSGMEDAERMDAELQPLYKACFVESNPIPAKAALSMMGLCRPEMRLPLVEASEGTVETMKKCLNEL